MNLGDTMSKEFNILLAQVHEIRDLAATLALLEWDMQTYLPAGAADGRAAQMETLAGVVHEKLTSRAFAHALESAEAAKYEPGSFEAALLRKLRNNFEKERKMPARLVREIGAASSAAYGAWLRAREEQKFSSFAPHLEKLLKLRQEQSALYAPAAHPLDPLLDDYEEGLTVAEIDPVFAVLRKEQTALVREAADRKQPDDSFLHDHPFSTKKQLELARFAAKRIGYDFRRGRIDLTEHPFTTSFGLSDVRITTKAFPQLPLSCLFSTIHEAGHAIYEQGIDRKFDRTPLADGASLAFHESQSRLWENQVGRGLPFWRWFYPYMQRKFPGELGTIPLERFYGAINRVECSLVRIEADEATYNLHILLRYDLEKALFENRLSVEELPEAWNEKMRQYLGLVPPNDLAGVLQDVHWAGGSFGYFPTYALGNLIAAQVWSLAHKEIPDLDEEIASGRFAAFRAFLRERVHHFGASLPPRELLRKLTGTEKINPAPFLAYLREKYLP